MPFDTREHDYNRECRDAVHGFVYLSDAEWAIVDCPTFQRLRDIRQLAMAHLVYPGAIHTRFEHSLGCLHLSNCIYEAVSRQVQRQACPTFAQAYGVNVELEKRGRQLLRLAGLLHDLGHSPFSHSGENLMPEQAQEGVSRKVTHEDMTANLIRDTEINQVIKNKFGPEWVEEVIAVATDPELARLPSGANRPWLRFLNEMLTGELGSDRMDYLLRDAMHSGQSAGLFDYRKLIDSMIIVPPPEESGEHFRLGLDEAGWLVAEQMVAARYLMYVFLYFHKTKRIYEIHLERFLAKWLEQELGSPCFPVNDARKYALLTDSRIWAAIYAAAQTDDDLGKLARPFVDRSHLRLACELLPVDNGSPVHSPGAVEPGSAESGRRNPHVWNAERFDKLAEAVNNHVRQKYGSASVVPDETKHHAAKFFGARDKIWVYLENRTRYLDELSEIVAGMPDKIWRGRIYAPEEIRPGVKSFCSEWLKANS